MSDIKELKEVLRAYGFNIKNVTGTVDATYPETVVVSKIKGDQAQKVADAMNLDYYRYNPDKNTGSAITIIVGEDFAGRE